MFKFYSQCNDMPSLVLLLSPPWPLLLILTSQYMLELVHIHIEGISGYDNTEILFFRLVKWVFMCDYTILPLLPLLLLVFRYFTIFLFSLSLSLSPRVVFSFSWPFAWMDVYEYSSYQYIPLKIVVQFLYLSGKNGNVWLLCSMGSFLVDLLPGSSLTVWVSKMWSKSVVGG